MKTSNLFSVCLAFLAGKRKRRGRHHRHPLPLLLEALEDRTLLATITWANPAGGNWNTGSNWNGGMVPGSGDDAVITLGASTSITITSGDQAVHSLQVGTKDALALSGGSLTIATASEIDGAFTLSGGTLYANSPLTIAGNGVWDSGTIHGSFTNIGTTTLAGSATKVLGGTLINSGTIIDTGTGALQLGYDGPVTGTLNNLKSGVYDFQSDASVVTGYAGISHITNAGTFRKSQGSGVSAIEPQTLDNSGTVEVDTATLAFINTAVSSVGGVFTVASGATLALTSGSTGAVSVTGTFTGSGNGVVQFAGNELDANAATFNFPNFQWTAGTIYGSLTNSGTMTLAGSNLMILVGSLTNAGTIIQTGGTLQVGNDPSVGNLNNLAGGVYDFQSAGLIREPSQNTGHVSNAGTFRKSQGTDAAVIETESFSNSGTVEVDSGTLAFTNTAVSSTGGVYTVAEGAALAFSSTASGYDISSVTGTFTGSGNGVVQFGGNELDANAATFNFPNFQWTAGTIYGSLTNTGTMTLAGPDFKILIGGLTNAGTIIHTGGTLQLGSDPSVGNLNNLAGGVYDFQSAGLIRESSQGTAHVTNAGTFRKSQGTEAAVIETASFSNSGTVEVDSGTLAFTNTAVSSTGGVYTVAEGAALAFSSTASGYDISSVAGTFTGSGNGVVQFGGNELDANAATFNFPNFQWTAGTIYGSLTNTGTMTLAGSDLKNLSGELTNAGTIVQTDTGWLNLGGYGAAGELNNLSGGTYDVQSDASMREAYQNAGIFNNAGTFQKSAGTGSFTLGVPFQNPGTTQVTSGTLAIFSAYGDGTPLVGSTLSGGTWNVFADARLDVSAFGNIITNNATITLSGAGSTFVQLATLAANTANFSILNGAAFTSAGDFTNSGALTVGASSTLSITGKYTQSATAALTIQVGGSPASGEYGQLNVSGQASLGGSLTVTLTMGTGFSANDSFQIIHFSGHSGNFSSSHGLTTGRVQLFGVVVNAQTIVLQALNQANTTDLAVDAFAAPDSGISGNDVTFTYTVENTENTPTDANSWVDSVYLSANDTLDPADQLITRVNHVGNVNGLSSYTTTVTAALPGAVPGNYRIIVVVDSAGFVADVNRANNTRASDNLMHVDIPVLTPGGTSSGTIDNGQDVYYRIDLPAGQVTRITANLGAVAGAEMYVRFLDVPDRANFDQVAFDPSTMQQQIVLNGTQAGSYYIRLHGREGSTGGQPFDISVQELGLQIVNISPTHGSNAGSTTVTIQGSKFTPNTIVNLVATDGSQRLASQVLFKDDTTLFATFDLTGLAPGSYNLRTDDSGSTATLTGAFTVNAGILGKVGFRLTSPAVVRAFGQGVVTIDYFNDGETDAPAPLMIVSSDNAKFQLPGQTTFVPNSVQLLGINQDGPAGILPPGYHGTISLNFLALSVGTRPIPFALSAIPATDTPFDWQSVESDLQPASVPNDAWDAIYGNFTASVGNTLGQYQAVLDNDATYLSQLGEYTVDVSRLLSFELQKADDFGAISQRYTLGAFGRGWPDPTDIKAVTDPSTNDVTIEYSGRVRSFFIQVDGSYQGVPGDAATLTKLANNGYQLRETDGTLTVFNPDGTLAYTQDTNGNTITANHTGGLLTSFVDSTKDAVSFVYDNNGRIIQVTDPVGRITKYTYDTATDQLLMSVTDPTGTTSYTYVTTQGPSQFAISSIAYPDGSHSYFTYDAQGRLTSQSADGGAQTVTYGYDGEGGISVTDAAGGTSTYFVNEFEQVAAYKDPLGHFAHFTFDANHNLIQETGPDGVTTTFTNNAAGDATSTVDPLGQRLTGTYNSAFNELTNLTDPRGNTIQNGYDKNGNLLSITYPDSSQEQFTYDPTGNLIESVDRNGAVINYKYDLHNLLIEEDFADGSKIVFTYDTHRNLLSATNANGTTSFQYDSADRLVKVTYPSGMWLAFAHNAAGQRTQMVDQTGFTVNYQYDAVGRLSGLTDGSNNLIVQYTYDSAGRLSEKLMGNGTSTKYGYDLADDLTSIVNYAPDNSVISQYVYAYDDQGRPISVTTLAGTTTYGYDADGQLTWVSLPDGRSITYEYDAAGNRVAVTDSGVTTNYTTNDLNEYTQVGSTTYTYDKEGNLVSQTDSTGTTSYTYNGLGQLVSVVSATGTSRYEYDALGNRINVTQNGQETQYMTDPTGLGNVVGEYDGSGSLVAHYTQALGLTSRFDATGSAAYYNFDGVGNATELTGAHGSVLNSYAYLPFGEQANAATAAPNPFTFVGQYGVTTNTNLTSLYSMRARIYDSAVGRFVSTDPLGPFEGEYNLYEYAGNGPTANVDPSGQCFIHGPLYGGPKNFVGLSFISFSKGFSAGGSVLEGGFGASAEVGPGGILAITALNLGVFHSGQGANGQLFGAGASYGVQGTLLNAGYSRGSTYSLFSFGVGWGNGCPGTNDQGPQPGDSSYPSSNKAQTHSHSPFDGRLGGADIGYGKSGKTIEQYLDEQEKAECRQAVSIDPNALIGPAGFGASGFLLRDQTLPYRIQFENQSTATAPAQEVVITEQLDPNLDWSTFQVGDFTIGGTTYQVPANNGFFSTRLDLRGTLGLFIDVSAGIDLSTGLATWTFTSLDPATLDLPADPLAGFLPPDTTPPNGEAFVTYTVRPKATDATGTRINAQATVVFDTNAPINTPQVFNTIDAGPPTSIVTPLPAYSRPNFTVNWTGQDDPGGSGVGSYDVYVSDNGGSYTRFLQGTTATSTTFSGQDGHAYSFYTIATDNVGNVQPLAGQVQTTTVVSPADHLVLDGVPSHAIAGGSFSVTINAINRDGNTDVLDNSSVALTLGSGPKASLLAFEHGDLRRPYIADFQNGVAIVNNLSFTATGTYTLLAFSSGDQVSAVSMPIVVSPATHFAVTADSKSAATSGTSFNITITALTGAGKIDSGYLGTVQLSSGDPAAMFPDGVDVTFTAGDKGKATVPVILMAPGRQTIAATDSTNASANGTSGAITVKPAGVAGDLFATIAPGMAAVVRGQPVPFSLTAGENGSGANTVFIFEINWGDGGPVETVTGTSGTMVSHLFAATGKFAAAVTVVDPSGKVCAQPFGSGQISVSALLLEPDPLNKNEMDLVIGGTAANDTIIIRPAAINGRRVSVSINGAQKGVFFVPNGNIVLYCQGGNDVVREESAIVYVPVRLSSVPETAFVKVPAIIFGGTGNDTLSVTGSKTNNILAGGTGNSHLVGGFGRDILIGGGGNDTLQAGSGDDILISGTTTYDGNLTAGKSWQPNLTALLALMAEWQSADLYATRVQDLFGDQSGGQNDGFLLDAATVLPSAAMSELSGGSGQDWFWLKPSDRLSGYRSGEVVTKE